MSETPYQQILVEWKALSRILGRNRNDLATTRAIASRFWTINDAISKYIIYRKDNDKNQQFYIKVMPATTGIPYMIYSMQSNTPISIGHYTTDPDTPVLYLKGR